MFLRYTLLAVFVLLSSMCWSQVGGNEGLPVDAYRRIAGLKLRETILKSELEGNYAFQGGSYLWYYLRLDSNMNYKIRIQDCLDSRIVERGVWGVLSGRLLRLTSEKGAKIFDVLDWKARMYLVDPFKRSRFIELVLSEYRFEMEFYFRETDNDSRSLSKIK